MYGNEDAINYMVIGMENSSFYTYYAPIWVYVPVFLSIKNLKRSVALLFLAHGVFLTL